MDFLKALQRLQHSGASNGQDLYTVFNYLKTNTSYQIEGGYVVTLDSLAEFIQWKPSQVSKHLGAFLLKQRLEQIDSVVAATISIPTFIPIVKRAKALGLLLPRWEDNLSIYTTNSNLSGLDTFLHQLIIGAGQAPRNKQNHVPRSTIEEILSSLSNKEREEMVLLEILFNQTAATIGSLIRERTDYELVEPSGGSLSLSDLRQLLPRYWIGDNLVNIFVRRATLGSSTLAFFDSFWMRYLLQEKKTLLELRSLKVGGNDRAFLLLSYCSLVLYSFPHLLVTRDPPLYNNLMLFLPPAEGSQARC